MTIKERIAMALETEADRSEQQQRDEDQRWGDPFHGCERADAMRDAAEIARDTRDDEPESPSGIEL